MAGSLLFVGGGRLVSLYIYSGFPCQLDRTCRLGGVLHRLPSCQGELPKNIQRRLLQGVGWCRAYTRGARRFRIFSVDFIAMKEVAYEGFFWSTDTGCSLLLPSYRFPNGRPARPIQGALKIDLYLSGAADSLASQFRWLSISTILPLRLRVLEFFMGGTSYGYRNERQVCGIMMDLRTPISSRLS